MFGLRDLAACIAITSGTVPAYAQQASATETMDCRYDSSILSLGIDAFDQDMDGGWRKIASQPGCEKTAADAIKLYREATQRQLGTLFWHEAQLRATYGDSAVAIILMQKARKPGDDIFGWNAYVDATISFLEGDRQGLLAARARLAQTPEPAKRNCVDTKGQKISCGAWPANLDVVDGLIACFGKPYAEAYGSECRPKTPAT
jgi:hypothetical protein